MRRKAIFIGATGQNVGKTTICLGLIAGLKKTFPKLGFMKPVGQQHELVEGRLLVDKDVVLFKEYFHLPQRYEDMSPVIFPSGFTREFLDGKVEEKALYKRVFTSFETIQRKSDFTIVEGTGHLGVGSIANLSNAQVASTLGLEMVIIVEGGVGKAYDELALNKGLCDKFGVKLAGVILNRVVEEKREMVLHYISKALKRWNVPLIGCIPYNQLLSTPTMEDFEILFKTQLLSGEQFHYQHFASIRLVATSVETFKELTFSDQLIVTPATREDIVYALLERRPTSTEPEHGLILTGRHPPNPSLIEALRKAAIPSLYAEKTSFEAMKMITSFTAKIRKEDTSKVEKAIQLVEKYVDLSQLFHAGAG